ncbi:unnamed protein product [Linum trigynum]|uniref:Uncharacterized protein n=1 Tax=Linum trigynum TaxID=586398 RepID=A0AAV2DRB7_9ROSI
MSNPVNSPRNCPKYYTKRTRLRKITTISKNGATNRILHQSKLELTDDHFCIAFSDNRRQTSRSCKRDCIPGCKEFCKIRIRDTIMLSTTGRSTCPSKPRTTRPDEESALWRAASKIIFKSLEADNPKEKV